MEYDVWKMIVMLSSERFGDEIFFGFLSVAMIMYSRIDQVTSQKVASILSHFSLQMVMDFQKLLLWRFLSAILEYKVQKFQKFTEQMMSIHLIDCEAFL